MVVPCFRALSELLFQLSPESAFGFGVWDGPQADLKAKSLRLVLNLDGGRIILSGFFFVLFCFVAS